MDLAPEARAIVDDEATWVAEELVPFYDAAEAARADFEPPWRKLKLMRAGLRPVLVPISRVATLLLLLLFGAAFVPAVYPEPDGMSRLMRFAMHLGVFVRDDARWAPLLVGAAICFAGSAVVQVQSMARLLHNQAFLESRARFEVAVARYHEAVEACIASLYALAENLTRGRSYDYALAHGYRKGLAELHDAIFDVPTATAQEVERLLDGKTMPGGTIGLSGSRGVGKTTIIRRHCLPRRNEADRAVRALVSVPVNYDAREFFLHLFAEVCRAVRGDVAFEEAQPVPRSIGRQILIPLTRVAGAGYLIFLYSQREPLLYDVPPPVAVMAVLGALSAAFMIAAPATVRRVFTPVAGPEHELQAEAATWLEVIRYQKSVDHKWEGAFKPPGGLQFGMAGSSTLTLQPLTLPEILARLNNFVERLAIDRPVYIGIDELDKLDSADAAAAFLNNLKGLFGQRGAFFLVSVSEQAMGQFEGRRRGIRTVFDSSLDRIVHVPPMTYAAAGMILDRRITALPVPFIALAYVLSCGVPRDLIRYTRLITESPATLGEVQPHLRSVLENMAAAEIRDDARAIRALVGPAADRDGSLALSLENAIPRVLTCEALQAQAVDLLAQAFQPVGESANPVAEAARASVAHAQAQFAATLYAWSACFQYFSAEPDADTLPAPEELVAEDHPLELLAAARRGLADGAHVCWKRTNDYYLTVGVDAIPWPGDEIAENPEDVTTG